MEVSFAPVQATYDALLRRLDSIGKGREMEGLMVKAINETAQEVRKMTDAATRGRYGIKPEYYSGKDLKKRMDRQKMEATIKVRGMPENAWKGYLSKGNSGKDAAGVMVLRRGSMKPVQFKKDGRTFKAFLAEMENGHRGIFQRNPEKKMKKDKRPEWTKREPKKKRKGREAVSQVIALSRSKAVEMAFEDSVRSKVVAELNYALLKHVNAVLGGNG